MPQIQVRHARNTRRAQWAPSDRLPWETRVTSSMPARAIVQPPLDPTRALVLARRAWCLTSAGPTLRVRGAVASDLAAVARMHGRSSADTRLQRYLMGGRAPSLALVATMLAQPLVMLALAPDGEVVAVVSGLRAHLRPGAEPVHAKATAFGLMVEDAWQGRGIGRALAAHLASAAYLLGIRELVAETAAATLPLRRVLDGVGPTKAVVGEFGSRLHTRLEPEVLTGLGALRHLLAG